MYLSPVALLGIYLYSLCGIAYIGKPICILILQKMLGMLLLYVLLQCWVCACYHSRLVKIIAQNVHPACALNSQQQSCRHVHRSDHDVVVCNEQMLGLRELVVMPGQSHCKWRTNVYDAQTPLTHHLLWQRENPLTATGGTACFIGSLLSSNLTAWAPSLPL